MSNTVESASACLQTAIEAYEAALKEAFGIAEVDKALQDDPLSVTSKGQNPENNDGGSNSRVESDSALRTQNAESVSKSEPLTLAVILNVLHARDVVQRILRENNVVSSQDSARLICLDRFLKSKANEVVQTYDFAQARESLRRPKSSWWWFLEAKSPDHEDPRWSRQDWIWNALSVVAIGLASTNIIYTTKAFSKSGFDWLGAFTTVAQGTVVLVFAGGAFTEKGQKISEDVFNSLNIPKTLHAESTFIISAGFCGVTYILAQQLPLVGAHYYQKGQAYEKRSNWNSAQDQYERALNFLPNKAKAYVALGNSYEYLSDLDKAEGAYKNAFAEGDSESAIRRARLLVLRSFDETKWQNPLEKQSVNKGEPNSNDELAKKELEQQATKEIERKAKLQEAQNILDIALARISQEAKLKKDKPRKSNSKENNSEEDNSEEDNPETNRLASSLLVREENPESIKDRSKSDRSRLRDIYIIYGIADWAQVNLEETDNEIISDHLSSATKNFQLAQAAEEGLPPLIGLQGLTKCYENLAILAEIRFEYYQYSKQMMRPTENSQIIPKELSDYLHDNDFAIGFYTSNLDFAIEDLGLTKEEIENANNGSKLKEIIARNLYIQDSFFPADACYKTLVNRAEISVLDSSIMQTILDARWSD